MLASVPARLKAATPVGQLESTLPTTAILGITWGITVLALAVLGFTLRAAIGFGERRARFASAVSHELRTPLTTFRMYSEMLADDIVTEPTARREYLATLRQEADRLARVVENVLAWSRLEEGRFAARRERHALPGLLARAAPPLQRRLADAGMVLAVELDDSAREAVLLTDEDAVGQILFNLVDNAAKYASRSGNPTINVQLSAEPRTVKIIVRDHGPGIAPDRASDLFRPFSKSAQQAANSAPGVGLGLALCRRLARQLGGDLRYEAPTGQGAAFAVILPRA